VVKLLLRGHPKTRIPGVAQPTWDREKVFVPDYFRRKAAWMRVLGLLLLIAFLPVMLLCIVLVRLTSRGPAIYHQTRWGKDQQLFRLYKIRTMYADCENLSGPVLCQLGDSRITPVGRVLRFLHLDELPQLINVARGDMCLVGPRPERPEIVIRHKLKETIPRFEERTKVLPGVTGLAQINLPADISAECVKPKVQLDLEYIETASIGMDLRILLCTAFRMIGLRHGRAARLLRLNRAVQRPSTSAESGNWHAHSRLNSHPPGTRESKSASEFLCVAAGGESHLGQNASPSWDKLRSDEFGVDQMNGDASMTLRQPK
jgi:lipopolysaccharide/colanic/teichoic acid biosynthesis glycosyltransferase